MGAREAHRAAVRGARRSRTSLARELGVGEREFVREVDDDETFTKKKVGAAALDESDGRRSASEAGRAPAQRPRRDRGIAAKQCRSSQPLNRLGQIRGDGGLRHGAAAARPPRRRAPGARTNSCQQKIRGLFTYRRACVCSFFRAKRI